MSRYPLIVLCLILTPAGHPAAEPWHRFAQSDMEMVSDLPVADARALLQKLVWFDRVVSEFVARSDEVQAPPLKILVFAERQQFNRVVAQRHFAAYTLPGIAQTTLVVGPDEAGDTTRNTLHEYMHYRLRTQPLAYPMWYEEGIASLLSTTEFTTENGHLRVTAGHAVPDELHHLSGPSLRLETVLNATSMDPWSPQQTARFYERSTELVQFFLFAPAAGQPDYRTRLEAYFADRSGEILSALEIDTRTLAHQMRQFDASRSRTFGSFNYDLGEFAAPEVMMSEVAASEMNHLFAQTAEMPNPRHARRLYTRLAKAHPSDPRFWVGLSRTQMQRNPKKALAALQTAASVQADHPEVLAQRAALLTRECPMDRTFVCVEQWREAAALLRQALEQDPDQFDAILRLGMIELYAGNPGGALGYLRIAHQRAPWSARVNFHLGECLRLLGNPRGTVHLAQARDWAQSEGLRNIAELAIELEEAR